MMMIARAWEKRGPILIGVSAGILAYFFARPFLVAAAGKSWHLDALYASVFNIAAAASAFLFAFYTYVRTSEGSILREIRGSRIFKRASQYMIRAIISSAVLAILSVPFLIVVPMPQGTNEIWYWVICIWAAFVAYVLAAIFRSAYHFLAIMEAAFGDRLG
jgi:hypothetical protein